MKLKLISTRTIVLLSALMMLLAACATQTNPVPASSAVEQPTEAAADALPDPADTIDDASAAASETADTAAQPQPTVDPSKYDDFQIVTLLPPDAIPAIDDPQFLTAEEAAEEYEPDELVIGVFINGEARAYSVPHLSSHEIVNDTVGGRKISVTW